MSNSSGVTGTRVARGLAGLVVLMLATSLWMVVAGEAASGRAARPAASAVPPVRLATYNINAGVSADRFAAGVKAVLPYADIVGLQEVNSKPKGAAIESLRASGWESWRDIRPFFHTDPTRGNANQVPVLWRASRFDLAGARAVRISGPANLGGELPGVGSSGRWVSVVRLRDKVTGQSISVVNVHLVRGAMKLGRKVKHRPRTFRLYRAQVAALAALAAGERRAGRQVFVMGDFNSDFYSENKNGKKNMPIRKLRSVGLTSMWALVSPRPKQGTRGRALLDQVFAAQRPASVGVLSSIRYSDHMPAVAAYLLPALPGYPKVPKPTATPTATPTETPSETPTETPAEPDPPSEQ